MNTFQIVRLIGDAPKEFLNFTETSLLTRMAFLGNKEGKDIRPGIKELLKQTKLSRMPLIKALGSLVKKDILIVCCSRSLGSWEKSCYDINVPLLQKISSTNYEFIENKSYKDKSKKSITKPKISSESSIAEIPLSGIAEIPVKTDFIEQVVSERYQGGIAEIPLSGIAEIPTPYIQLLEPLDPPIYVELGASSTCLVSEKKSSKTPKQKKSWKLEVEEIFGHWKKVLNHPVSKLDKKRYDRIEKALKMDYSVEDLKKAIDGIKRSEFHMGDNGKHKKYDGIHVIFRDPEQIEGFISDFDTQTTPRNKNVATALKMTFVEKNKMQINMLDDIEAKYFPEFANRGKQPTEKENLLTFRQEREINERE